MTTTTRTFIALQDRHSGDLLRLQANDDGYSHYRLTSDEQYPVFEVENADDLALVLMEDVPCYNSRPKCPSWGGYEREDMEPVMVTMTIEKQPLELPKIRLIDKTVELRSIPASIARKYAGRDIGNAELSGEVIFWLVQVPEGETLESIKSWEGQTVFAGDRYTRRKVFAAVDVPEDYEDLLQGAQGALLIASSTA